MKCLALEEVKSCIAKLKENGASGPFTMVVHETKLDSIAKELNLPFSHKPIKLNIEGETVRIRSTP